MIDVDDVLRTELRRLTNDSALSDWDAVVAGSRLERERARRRLTAGAALVVAAVAIGLATPLGAAIARGLDGFSAWLTGQPGSPASSQEQRSFDLANARSWLRFPSGTKLRHLSTVIDPHDGVRVELFGFRAGTTLCLRVVVSGKTKESTTSCAPLADLRQAGAPVRVLVVDHGFGRGTKQAWFGIDRYRSSARQVTAGIVADGVSKVIVRDRGGRHLVRPLSNAFLYVATEPDAGQRVSSIRASTSSGLVDVPFSPPQFGFGGPGASTQPLPGPTQIQRHVHGGAIGWLNRREPRGRPLNVIPSRNRGLIARHTVFGRVIAPDPGRPVVVALTLSTSRHGGKATGLCGWIISRATGAAGGCQIRADLFKHNPLSSGVALSGSDQFATFQGLASDDVDHVVAFLANGQTMAVPLEDNVYLIDVARSKLPMRLVAYDARNRIIGFEEHPLTGLGRPSGGPAAGRAKTLLKATSPTGATAELLVGGSSDGGRCMYVRWYHERHIRGVMLSCQGPAWHGQPLQLGTSGSPAEVIWGRVRPDVALVRLNFARGSALTVKPTEGMILTFVPQGHLAPGSRLVSVDGFNKAQRRVGTESLRPQGKR